MNLYWKMMVYEKNKKRTTRKLTMIRLRHRRRSPRSPRTLGNLRLKTLSLRAAEIGRTSAVMGLSSRK